MNLIQKSAAEFFGTFAIVFFGCGSLMVIERFPNVLSPILVPVVFGLAVAAMIYAVGHISGAHFNPAVTLAFTVVRHFPKNQILAYWLAQFLGATTAVAILNFILPTGTEFGAVLSNVGIVSSMVWEGILTFFLMFVIIAVATDTRAEGTMAGIAIGAAVTIGAYVGGPVTGAAMNPARALAPAIFQNQWDHIWIYFVGPCAGSVLAALTYEWIRCDPKKKDAKGCC